MFGGFPALTQPLGGSLRHGIPLFRKPCTIDCSVLAMRACHHSLRIVAKPREISHGTGRAQWEVRSTSSWVQDQCRFVIIDPWSPDDEDHGRWYLEKHLRKDPFAITKARQIEGSLAQYGRKLREQIQLGDLSLLSRQCNQDDQIHRHGLEITIIDEALPAEGLDDTVHRLHWELLEDPTLWPEIKLGVTVRRLVSVDVNATYKPGSVRSWPHAQPSTRSTFNVLLVLARDLSTDTDLDEEVNPNLASQVLLKIRSEVSKVQDDLDIQVEVVRPSTLPALDECLMSRPPGYFQLVHFDTHGRVAKDRATKTKQAYLLLDSGKTSGRLAPVKASTVGHLLAKRGVRLCFLNSCDSAKANCGDGANLAAIFVREGVCNVLAMSFHLLESAATKFLRSFYVGIILKKLPFSLAVSAARADLREDPSRHAMQNLKRHLHDWIIPVVYASGEDAQILSDTPEVPGDFQTGLTEEDDEEMLVGRDFDLLRFERALIKHGTVCLAGTAGIGKSSFVQMAVQSWTRTGFCDMALTISLAANDIRDSQALSKQILHAIVDEEAARRIMTQVAASGEDGMLQRVVISILRSARTTLILEDLQHTHSGLSERYLPSSLRESEQTDISDFLAEAVATPRNPSAGEEVDIPVRLILISRASSESDWDFHFKSVTRKVRFELPPLQMSDAIRLGTRLLERAGVNTSAWRHRDVDILDQVVSILQCNPFALEAVLPVIARAEDWSNVLDKLMPHDVALFPDLLHAEQSGLVREMNLFWATLGEEGSSILKYLSLFWNSGPFISTFAQSAQQLQLCSDAAAIQFPLHFCRERGWIKIDVQSPQPHISDIHPLFTLFLRQVIIRDHKSRIESEKDRNDVPQPQELSESTATKSPASLSATVLSTFPCLYCRGSGTFISWPIAARELLEDFFASISVRQLYLFQSHIILATDVEEAVPKFHAELHNIIWVASMCSDSRLKIPVSVWPIDGLKTFLATCRIYQSPAEAKQCVSHFAALVDALVEQSNGVPLAGEELYFGLWIFQYLVNTLRSEATVSLEKTSAFAKAAVELAEASVKTHGLPEDENTQLQVSVAYRNRALTLLDEGNYDEADRYWGKMLDIDRQLFERSAEEPAKVSEDAQYNSERLEYFKNLFPDQEIDQKKLQALSINRRLADQPWVASWHQLRKSWWAVVKNSVQNAAQTDKKCDAEERKIFFSELAHNLESAENSLLSRGLSRDRRWWPDSYDAGSFQKFVTPNDSLDVASNALERGDWRRVIESYQELARNAERRIDLDEAVELVKAASELHQREDALDARADDLAKAQSVLEKKQRLFKEVSRIPGLCAASDYAGALAIMKNFREESRDFDRTADIEDGLDAVISDLEWRAGRQNIDAEHIAESVTSTDATENALEATRRMLDKFRDNPQAATQYYKMVAIVSRELNQLDRAQSVQDFGKAILHLDRLLELSEEGDLDQLISRSVLETERSHILSRGEWHTTSHDAFALAEANRFAESYVLFDEMEAIASRPGHLGSDASLLVKQLRGHVEGMELRAVQEEIKGAMDKADWNTTFQLADSLLKAYAANKFANAEASDPSQMPKVLRRLRRERLNSMALIAEDDNNWEQARAAAEELLAFAVEENDLAKMELYRVTTKRYTVKFHNKMYADSQREFRFDDAEEHLNKLIEIAKEDLNHPERNSSSEIMVSLDSLEWCKVCLDNQRRQIRELGEDRARQNITAARDLQDVVQSCKTQ